jgi:hypothetical protein
VYNRDIHKSFKKEKEKVGNKRGGRKIKERKRKIKRGKKESFK